MAFSLFDHPFFSTLLRHDEIDELFSPAAEIAAMLRFELALAEVEAAFGVIPKEAGAEIVKSIRRCQPSADSLADGIRRDGVVGPALVDDLRLNVPEIHRRFVHFGATSQDVIDSGLILRLKQALTLMRQDLETVIARLDSLSSEQGDTLIMGRTRMQRALPITFAERIATWKGPLIRQLEALDGLEHHVLAVQFGGAVGTLDKLGDQGAEVRTALAKHLDLTDPGRPWHAERDRIADLANWLAKISGSLGKIGQDLALMTQNEIGEAKLADSGSSSTMPHKQNPVQAEILITLARLNAGHLASIHQAMVHEGERSGAAWMLEWLILPEMIAATAASLMISAQSLEGLTVTCPD